MTQSRRSFLATLSAATGLAALPGFVRADLSIGSASLTTVSDGTLVLPGDFIFAPMPKDELAPILAEYGVSRATLTPECNLSLYRDGTNTVLFDVGSGPDFMPTSGKTLESLEALGLTVDDITHVVFTHAHPDHLWGMLDDFDEPLFANATHMMGRAEWDYWWDPETVNTIGDARATFAVGARRRMEVIEDMIELFDDQQEILPGVAAMASYGHSPGHMAFELRAGSDSAMIVGDAIGNHHVAFARPGWNSASDQDEEMAARTREILMDRLAAEQMRMIGFHLPNGGIGRVEKTGDAYRFVQEDI